jgi:serine phosphatase RsbU (regulator of sigma subunit)/anti-sigma regulatory factor (Ser/Thr protein kinase)
MGIQIGSLWQSLTNRGQPETEVVSVSDTQIDRSSVGPEIDIAPNDPLVGYFLSNPSTVELDKLHLDSPALSVLKHEGVRIAVPLVSQGELVGLLSLGPRLSEQEYSTDDRRLLTNLATQAAPALRVAQLARQQQAEARERERLEQELRVASIIQQTLLPESPPEVPGWQMAAYWQPARSVGGDFYDFIDLPDGRMCVIVADVTDKGVPAALVMASARSVLRAAAERLQEPGEILARVNNTMHAEIPPNMFVTCLCVVLDLQTGHIRYANAGHNLPYLRTSEGVVELRATGMPLGLMPDMEYEEGEMTLAPGDTLLFHSDGMAEAHSPDRELFGFPRLQQTVAECPHHEPLIEYLLAELDAYTGPDWEQEDDVTFVLVSRESEETSQSLPATDGSKASNIDDRRMLAEFSVPSAPGNERDAMERVAELVENLALDTALVERLKTAVSEATMNAMEHGNQYQPDLQVTIRVLTTTESLVVQVTDQGGDQPVQQAEEPDLASKLAGIQSSRGWGLFLVENMVDEVHTIDDDEGHTVEMILNTKGGGNGSPAV